ncbi:hypothetical protein [Mycobacterium sp.]|uniref:hypothetical protein n=1 Tax=Mycobacterium sp. TaxID=1785 RepID=UPI003D0A1A18
MAQALLLERGNFSEATHPPAFVESLVGVFLDLKQGWDLGQESLSTRHLMQACSC